MSRTNHCKLQKGEGIMSKRKYTYRTTTSPKQVAQQHRFVYKGALASTLNRLQQARNDKFITAYERSQLSTVCDLLEFNLQFCDELTKVFIKEAK